jgi:hypothetical protein
VNEIAYLLAMYLALLPLWALLASPVLLVFFFLARSMRRRSIRSAWVIAVFASTFSLLAAPVPTPIITVLVPHGLAVLDRGYYPGILHGPEIFAGLWQWIIPSLLLTFVATLVVAWHYLRPLSSVARIGP